MTTTEQTITATTEQTQQATGASKLDVALADVLTDAAARFGLAGNMLRELARTDGGVRVRKNASEAADCAEACWRFCQRTSRSLRSGAGWDYHADGGRLSLLLRESMTDRVRKIQKAKTHGIAQVLAEGDAMYYSAVTVRVSCD